MSPPEVWGPAVWTLFHTLAERVSEHAYPFIYKQLFEQIILICKFLPCPDCSTDATSFLAKINISNIETKIKFKNLFYLFHNYVNAKKRKPLFNYSNIYIYINYPLIPIVNNFIAKYNTKGNLNLINESFQRNLVKKTFRKWIINNIGAFVPPPQLIKNISEPKLPIEQNQEQIIEQNQEQIIEQNIEQNQEQIIEEIIEQNQEQIIEQNQEQNIEQNQEQIIEQNQEQIIEDNIQSIIEMIYEPIFEENEDTNEIKKRNKKRRKKNN